MGRALLALVTLLAWAPLGLLLLGMGIAGALGCAVNEAGAQPCLFHGIDLGHTLYFLFMMGWLMIVALPVMLATAVAWLVLGTRWLGRRFR